MLVGFELLKDGSLKVTDQDVLDKQKGMLAEVAKQLTINLLKGLSIAHISLPIRIFDTRSSIQRIVSLWSYAKTHLNNAVNTKDPIERIKWVLCFGICGLYLQLN